MASFLLRSGFLIVYFGLTFFLIRLFRWYETLSSNLECVSSLPLEDEGAIMSPEESKTATRQLCQPLVNVSQLNGRVLKDLLLRRGIIVEGPLEKQDLVRLLRQSGSLTPQEITEALQSSPQTEVIPFQSSMEFVERVQDCMDSAWLIRVLHDSGGSGESGAVEKPIWLSLVQRYELMGLRFGVLDCARMPDLCNDRGFANVALLLAVPRTTHSQKSSVGFHLYPRLKHGFAATLPQLARWISEVLMSKVSEEKSLKSGNETAVDVAFLYEACDGPPQVPLLLPLLAVRFAGRVRVQVNALCSEVNTSSSSSLSTSSSSRRQWRYHLQTRMPLWPFSKALQWNYTFGTRPGEWPTFESLSTLLSWCYPEQNDVFMFGLRWCAAVSVLQFFCRPAHFSLESVMVRLFHTVWTLFITFVVFFVGCLPLLKVLHVAAQFAGLHQLGLALTHSVALSEVAILIRGDVALGWWTPQVAWPWFLLFGCGLSAVYALWFGGEPVPPHADRRTSREQSPSRGAPWANETMAYWADIEIGPVLQNLGQIYFTLPMEPYTPSFIERLQSFQYPKSHGNEEEVEMEEEEDEDVATVPPSGWPTHVMFSSQCVICLEKYVADVLICPLPCGHAFHDVCVKTWLQQKISRECPTCRWPAFKVKA